MTVSLTIGETWILETSKILNKARIIVNYMQKFLLLFKGIIKYISRELNIVCFNKKV